jgi:hypothetical protein
MTRVLEWHWFRMIIIFLFWEWQFFFWNDAYFNTSLVVWETEYMFLSHVSYFCLLHLVMCLIHFANGMIRSSTFTVAGISWRSQFPILNFIQTVIMFGTIQKEINWKTENWFGTKQLVNHKQIVARN